MTAGDDRIARTIRIRGRVQGVGFRAWMADTANSLGLQGWVRNRRDGTVEARLVGTTAAVEMMLQACRQGPSAARVEAIEITADEVEELEEKFQQWPTI